MPSNQRIRGECVFCGRELTNGGFSRHLRTCGKRQEAIQNAQDGRIQMLYHLQIRNAYASDFWLHLEMNGTAELADLDDYLRVIWLECCGHLSQISVGRKRWGSEISMDRTARQILKPDMELTHIYDFGSSTETAIKVVDVREGKPLSKYPIYLMARNDIPDIACDECGKPAQWLREDFEYNSGDWLVALCNDHVEKFSGEDYGEPFEMVNSPRLGVCGYMGPATPPY
jgi:endogenous inhibitor of DNA gyrase (YacG/DUF329 family)